MMNLKMAEQQFQTDLLAYALAVAIFNMVFIFYLFVSTFFDGPHLDQFLISEIVTVSFVIRDSGSTLLAVEYQPQRPHFPNMVIVFQNLCNKVSMAVVIVSSAVWNTASALWSRTPRIERPNVLQLGVVRPDGSTLETEGSNISEMPGERERSGELDDFKPVTYRSEIVLHLTPESRNSSELVSKISTGIESRNSSESEVDENKSEQDSQASSELLIKLTTDMESRNSSELNRKISTGLESRNSSELNRKIITGMESRNSSEPEVDENKTEQDSQGSSELLIQISTGIESRNSSELSRKISTGIESRNSSELSQKITTGIDSKNSSELSRKICSGMESRNSSEPEVDANKLELGSQVQHEDSLEREEQNENSLESKASGNPLKPDVTNESESTLAMESKTTLIAGLQKDYISSENDQEPSVELESSLDKDVKRGNRLKSEENEDNLKPEVESTNSFKPEEGRNGSEKVENNENKLELLVELESNSEQDLNSDRSDSDVASKHSLGAEESEDDLNRWKQSIHRNKN